MLYCPRCNREYNEGAQRFCIHDGGRLMPKAAAANRKMPSGGVFTNLVEKSSAPDGSDEILSLPNFVPVSKPTEIPQAPSFIREPEFSEVSAEISDKPTGKQININELPSFQAPLGDRKKNPTGRLALSWENPNVLLGHVIRGRYFIEQRISHDDICITYLAQDRGTNNKRVIFKVLALGSDFIQNSAEERVALSHLNHPHIVKILDSGEMPEGMPFAVFEYVEGSSLRDLLDSGDPIPASDTGRIVKQISEALSGAQQNGVLHYDVRPQKVILKPEADGTPIAKVTDFALAKGYKAPLVRKLKDVAYQSPEQLQGREISPASESYSLAAIAYEMLTGRLPFNFESMRELFDAQKRGLASKPSMILPQLPAAVDDIFTRALSYNADARFQKARDFGEALYGALGTAAPAEYAADEPRIKTGYETGYETGDEILALDDRTGEKEFGDLSRDTASGMAGGEDVLDLGSKPKISSAQAVPAVVQATPALAWEKHVQESEGLSKWAIATICLIGAIIIGSVIFTFLNYSGEPAGQPQVTTLTDAGPQGDPLAGDQNPVSPAQNPAQDPPLNSETAPPPRTIEQPPGTVSFINTKEGMPPGLLRNFRGFSLYYPSDWVKNPSEKNFLDISKNENGLPVEQMLVSWYESKGTFSADKASFSKLAREINKSRSAAIPNFKSISEGETTINNGRPVYEVKFQGEGETGTGEKLTIWGKTYFFPAGRLGIRNGFIITMLATSRSPEVKSADDVGTKGQLKEILYTLEPAPLDGSF